MADKVTILVDNIGEEPLQSEHGFSIKMELNDKKILFDTGQGEALFINAKILGIALDDLDILILSHGHYDHSGNIKKIIEMNPLIDFYAHPDCLKSRISYYEGKPVKYVSLTEENIKAINSLPENQKHWCIDETEILPGVWVTGTIERKNDYEDTGGAFYTDSLCTSPDLLPDDMSLWIEKEDSLTIICGCCHSGLQNTVEKILSLTKRSSIDTIIGGLHLVKADENRIKKTISFIKTQEIGTLIGAHCTSEKAVSKLKEKLGKQVALGKVGLTLKL